MLLRNRRNSHFRIQQQTCQGQDYQNRNVGNSCLPPTEIKVCGGRCGEEGGREQNQHVFQKIYQMGRDMKMVHLPGILKNGEIDTS